MVFIPKLESHFCANMGNNYVFWQVLRLYQRDWKFGNSCLCDFKFSFMRGIIPQIPEMIQQGSAVIGQYSCLVENTNLRCKAGFYEFFNVPT